MKYQEIATKSVGELYDSLYDVRKEILGLNLQKSMQQLQSSALIRQKRKDAARISTALNALKKR